MHAEILARTGGTPGLLNPGAVDSALYRAQWGPFFGVPDVEARAALILRGLCQDHPFADGNKRTSYEAAALFLGLNRTRLEVPADEIVAFMLAVAQDEVDLDSIAEWLRRHARKG